VRRADPKKRLEELERIFAALAHPARRQILLTVHFWGGAMRAGDVANRFGHSWPTTTRHLQVLELAGLLTHEKVGRTRTYRLNRDRLNSVKEWFTWFDAPADAVAARQESLRMAAS
jgi:DNA-binding transcriptional ArsR family regulator